MNYFTNSLLDFLSSLKHNKHFPEINNLYISNDNTKLLTLNMEERFNSEGLSIPILFNGSLCFMILDSYIDSIFPEMEGTSFKNKYEKLPKNTNIEIMFSQLYRILKLFRNATVHNISGISITKDQLEIMYNQKHIENIFIITHKGIELIEDMILCYFNYEQINYSYHYREYLYYSFFDDILKEIISYNDEYNNIVKVNSIKINRIERYICDSIDYSVTGDKIIFNIPQKLINKMNLAIDIKILINEEYYIIPLEVIDHSMKIALNEVSKFRLK